MGKIFCPNKQSLTKLNFSNTIPASYTFQTWNSNTTKSIAKQNANSPPKKTENGKQKGQKKEKMNWQLETQKWDSWKLKSTSKFQWQKRMLATHIEKEARKFTNTPHPDLKNPTASHSQTLTHTQRWRSPQSRHIHTHIRRERDRRVPEKKLIPGRAEALRGQQARIKIRQHTVGERFSWKGEREKKKKKRRRKENRRIQRVKKGNQENTNNVIISCM